MYAAGGIHEKLFSCQTPQPPDGNRSRWCSLWPHRCRRSRQARGTRQLLATGHASSRALLLSLRGRSPRGKSRWSAPSFPHPERPTLFKLACWVCGATSNLARGSTELVSQNSWGRTGYPTLLPVSRRVDGHLFSTRSPPPGRLATRGQKWTIPLWLLRLFQSRAGLTTLPGYPFATRPPRLELGLFFSNTSSVLLERLR